MQARASLFEEPRDGRIRRPVASTSSIVVPAVSTNRTRCGPTSSGSSVRRPKEPIEESWTVPTRRGPRRRRDRATAPARRRTRRGRGDRACRSRTRGIRGTPEHRFRGRSDRRPRDAMRSRSASSSPGARMSCSTWSMKRRSRISRSRHSARARRRELNTAPVFWRKRSIVSTSSATPAPVVATVRSTGGRHESAGHCSSDSIDSIDAAVRSAPSRSALLTTKTSAISMMPALRACTSSPAPGTMVTTDTSAVRTMSTSSWPTPTVSTITTS